MQQYFLRGLERYNTIINLKVAHIAHVELSNESLVDEFLSRSYKSWALLTHKHPRMRLVVPVPAVCTNSKKPYQAVGTILSNLSQEQIQNSIKVLLLYCYIYIHIESTCLDYRICSS